MITLYYFGKKKEMLDQEQELVRRIGFRDKIDVRPLDQAGTTDGAMAKKQEGEKLLSKIKDDDFLIVLHERGTTFDSIQFANKMQFIREQSRSMVFVIGGAYGLGDDVLDRANMQWSLGKMVWTRQLARYMTLEQIYRAFEINNGSNFHKA